MNKYLSLDKKGKFYFVSHKTDTSCMKHFFVSQFCGPKFCESKSVKFGVHKFMREKWASKLCETHNKTSR